MEINPTYVTFEQAQKFKDKGLNFWCKYRYTDFDGRIELEENASEIFPYAPEQWQVVEWLRIKYGICIHTKPENNEEDKIVWEFVILKIKEDEVWFGTRKSKHNSPQEAYLAAFDYVLKELI